MERVNVGYLSGYTIENHYRKSVITCKKLIEASQSNDKILLNMADAEWFTPAFLTPLSVVYNKLVNSGTHIQIRRPNNHGIQAYLSQIGFPEGHQQPPQRYDNHLPLAKISGDMGDEGIETLGSEIIELVQNHLSDLPTDHVNAIYYPIDEIVANVRHHSQCNYGAILVQRYSHRDYLDICIADDGISIPGSFDNHDISYDRDSNAIENAMREGVSTKEAEGFRDIGHGLSSTADVVCNGLNGDVMITSRKGMCKRNGTTIDRTLMARNSWDGTVFIARLRDPDSDFRLLDYITS